MDQKETNPLEKFMCDNVCLKDYICVKDNQKNILNKSFYGIKQLLLCIDENPELCPNAVIFGSHFFCQCEKRHQILDLAKKQNKADFLKNMGISKRNNSV